MKNFLFAIERLVWSLKCSYALYLHGPYGLSKVIEKMPFRFLIVYLRKYGAQIGSNCRFERGLNIHRPLGLMKPFENLVIGNNVYLGHNTLIDLTKKVTIEDNVIIASRTQIWTHASFYNYDQIPPLYGENTGEVSILPFAMIYSGVIISYGVTIGENVVIGASSLVNKSINIRGFYAGLPIRKIK